MSMSPSRSEYIQEEIDLGLRDSYGVVNGGCEDEIRDRFFRRNDDDAMVEAIYKAREALKESEDLDEYLKTLIDNELKFLCNSQKARENLRITPMRQVEMGISSNINEEIHSLFF